MIRARVLSVPVVLATLAALAAGAISLYIYFSWAGRQRDLTDTRTENAYLATVLAQEVTSHRSLDGLDAFTPMIAEEEQWATVRLGATTWTGGEQPKPGDRTTSTQLMIPGGQVTVVGHLDPAIESPVGGVVAGVLAIALVIGVAATSLELANRRVRRRVDVAVQAAERVSTGDFAVRIGAEGSGELARLGRAFDLMAGRLQAVDADQRQLLADLAHEIATPVHALAGFAVAVLDGTIPRERAEPVISSHAERLSRLLGDLAQLRALDAAAGEPPQPMDLNQVAAEQVGQFSGMARDKGLTLRALPARRPVVVTADHALVDSVLRNLVSNAIRYTPSGGDVGVAVRLEGRAPVIEVRDDGPGIAPEHRERIFDRFYRVDAARDRGSGGSGLGLAIARRAAAAMGAELRLDSAPGAGSVFSLAFAPPKPRAGEA